MKEDDEPGLSVYGQFRCVFSAGFLSLNLRIQILDPLFIKDPFLFDLSQT